MQHKNKEPTKWALVVQTAVIPQATIARFARSVSYLSLSWGFASLHPRLYAFTRYAGLFPCFLQDRIIVILILR